MTSGSVGHEQDLALGVEFDWESYYKRPSFVPLIIRLFVGTDNGNGASASSDGLTVSEIRRRVLETLATSDASFVDTIESALDSLIEDGVLRSVDPAHLRFQYVEIGERVLPT